MEGQNMTRPIKHILVIRLSAMGDVAMAVPVLGAFTAQYPDVKLTVLTRQFYKPFFRHLENVTVFSADINGDHKGVFGLYNLSQQLKTLHIDAVADLHNVLRTKILKMFFVVTEYIQIDKGRDEKRKLINGYFKQLKTTHQRYTDVFEKLGFPVDLAEYQFPPKPKLNSKVNALLGNKSLKWIGIAPFATHESKMYPTESMEQVIAELSKKYKIILFGGGESEIEKLNVLASKFDNVTTIAGVLNLDEELDLISNLDIMVSMDSGNGHIAAMLGVKVLTLWGATHPYAGFAPFNQPMEHSLFADRDLYPKIPTSVYGNKAPEDYKDAMKTITPEMVVQKATNFL